MDHLKEDHKEQEFKPKIIGGILDLPKKSSKTREASKYDIIDYGVTMDLQQKSFIELPKVVVIDWKLHYGRS